jgi:hypothetical protein
MPSSTDHSSAVSSILPLPMPANLMQRRVLFAMRRMAVHGLCDAFAANMMLNTFGIRFRQPLVLLRGFMAELAQCSTRNIVIAPCCVLRMTTDEATLVGVLTAAVSNPACAARHLRIVTKSSDVSAPLSLARTFNKALADAGQPLLFYSPTDLSA